MAATMLIRVAFGAIVLFPLGARACLQSGEAPLFFCEAVQGRKYIELCDSNLDQPDGYLVYRFGALDERQGEKTVELEYPPRKDDSLQHFFAATYGNKATVRFVSGNHDYTVFARPRTDAKLARQLEEARKELDDGEKAFVETEEFGVEVRDRKTKKVTTIFCGEVPRFYIYELKDRVPCDPETPVGTACVK